MKKQRRQRRPKAHESKQARKLRVKASAERRAFEEQRYGEAVRNRLTLALRSVYGDSPTEAQHRAFDLLSDYDITREEAEAFATQETALRQKYLAEHQGELTEADEDAIDERVAAEMPTPESWETLIRTQDGIEAFLNDPLANLMAKGANHAADAPSHPAGAGDLPRL